MVQRIDFLAQVVSQYGVLHLFVEQLMEACQRAGAECRMLSIDPKAPQPFFSAIQEDPPDCTLSFNGVLPDETGERFLCDMIEIPHVAVTVDSPVYFFPLVGSVRNIITCVDKFACDAFREFDAQNVLFLPHAVDRSLAPDPEVERTHDVVMLSSCIDYEWHRKMWWDHLPKAVAEAIDEAAEVTFAELNTSYIVALRDSIGRRVALGKIDPRGLSFPSVMKDLEFYIRGRDRVELIRNITDAKVEVYGAPDEHCGWEKYLGDQPNVEIHDQVDYPQALDLMRRSKIVLNSCVWMKNGSHERVFAGLACGALVLTHDNIYMREQFQDGESIAFYRSGKWDNVNETINSYLADEENRQRVAENGRKITMASHTWDNRAETLLQALPPMLKKINDALIY